MQYGVSVTAGANQALASLMITLLDPEDRTVVFRPYYFNALMAVQMMGGGNTISYGPSDPDTFYPDLDWLEQEFKKSDKPKLVYLVNPCNPTGYYAPCPCSCSEKAYGSLQLFDAENEDCPGQQKL